MCLHTRIEERYRERSLKAFCIDAHQGMCKRFTACAYRNIEVCIKYLSSMYMWIRGISNVLLLLSSELENQILEFGLLYSVLIFMLIMAPPKLGTFAYREYVRKQQEIVLNFLYLQYGF